MQISDFSVNKYNFSKFFVDSREKSLGSVLFSRDGRVTANIYTFFLAYDKIYSQPVFACSKLTIESLEQGVKYVQS